MSVNESSITQQWTDMLERALYTAVEAFLAVFVVTDLSTLESAGTASVAALLSAVKTLVVQRKQALG